MPPVEDVCEPCALETHAGFDGRELETGPAAMVAGDGRAWETAGRSAGPKAGDGYRASSLRYR